MSRLRVQLLVGLLAVQPLLGCTCHSTDSTQIGVLTRKVGLFGLLGTPGVQEEVFAPGATYMFPPIVTDWRTFDVSLQNLKMLRDPKSGDRSGEDDVTFKTVDGNDIRVDVTVAWRIDPKRASYLLQRVGEDTEQIKEKLVRPASRGIIRDVLNELNSEEFYVSDKRFAKANKAKEKLAEFLGPEGVIVEQVILGDYHFHPQYEQVIQEKKLAEQHSERIRSEGRAAAEQSKSNLERAKGTVAQQLAQTSGALEQVKLNADAEFYEKQQQAEAIVAEKKAKAKAIQKQNEALSGGGGKTLVKLKMAEALAGKQILFIPTGRGGAAVQTLNVNQLIGSFVGKAAVDEASSEPKPAP